MPSNVSPSLAQLSEQLEARLREIQENPTVKAAREDRATKNEITALRDDVSALKDTVESLQADLKTVSKFVGKLVPPPIPPEDQLEVTRRAFKDLGLSVTGPKKVDISVVDIFLRINGLSPNGSKSDRRTRLENAITPCDDQYSEPEEAEEVHPDAKPDAEPFVTV